MTLDEYQNKALRTINLELVDDALELHALHGLASEVGEIHGLYQKVYQGHKIDMIHLQKEIGDCLWFLAELCTANGMSLEKVGEMNIAKLESRYPHGFDASHSIHRKDGDI